MLGVARCAVRRLFSTVTSEASKATVATASSTNNATTAEVVSETAGREVVDEVKAKLDDRHARLFAVVYFGCRQFKVGENDLISVTTDMPLSAGDKINLEKVLMVGGKDWSVLGRPLLHTGVKVKATVVEKGYTAPELKYLRDNHKKIKITKWHTRALTVLRINEIAVDRSLLGPTE